jgi:teichuronic acid biosynthesis glycosyltransferase TuaC
LAGLVLLYIAGIVLNGRFRAEHLPFNPKHSGSSLESEPQLESLCHRIEQSMLRILAVTNIYPTPQAPFSGTFVEQQIRGMRQIGLDVDLMFLDRAKQGMRVYLGLGRQIRARIVSYQPHLVHVMYGGVMANEVTRAIADRPTVVSFCGSDLLGEPLSGIRRKLLARYGVIASYRAARRTCGIVVKSKNLQDALPEDADRSKVRIIPNGVDLERFRPLDQDECRERLGWGARRFHVLFPTNSGDPLKRPELAKAAVEAANHSGVQAEMHQLQGVPHAEVPIWLNASDVVFLTSVHEGSPNIVKEALACNVPVVSVDVGDVRERIQGIEGCYLAAPELGDLAAKLQMVHAGPRRVVSRTKMQELSLERVALQLKEFYSEVLVSFEKRIR